MKPSGADPFPRDEFTALLRRLPAYAQLAWRLGRDPRLSGRRRAAILAAAGYLVSPIDLVPGVIPVMGQLDDIIVGLTALLYALAGLKAEDRERHLVAVGISEDDLRTDRRTALRIAAWIARKGARLGARAAMAASRAIARAVVAGGRAAASVARRRIRTR